MTRAPEQTVDPPSPGDAHDDDDDRHLEFNGRTVLTLCGFLAAAILALYLLLPQLAGLEDTWSRIEDGSPAWIVLAFVLTFGMFVGYVEMFRGVFGEVDRIGRQESYLITMAGLAASRIFAAGGAGGLVLQAWALRQAGLAKRAVADKTIAFLVLTYFPYAAAVVICGVGLRLGIFPGEAPFTMTVIPAIIAVILMALTSLILLVPTDLQRRLDGFARRTGMLGRVAQKLATIPAATSAGLHEALTHIRSRNPGAARRDRLLGLPDRRAVGRLPGLRRRAAGRRADPGLLRRHARQPAADPRRRRRRRRWHDRCVRRVRRRRRARGGRRARLPRVHVLASAAARGDRLLPSAGKGGGMAPGTRRYYTK